MNRPSHSDPKPLYRHTYCVGCPGDVWLKWNRGHKWTCEKGHVRIEDVWNSAKTVRAQENAQTATEQENVSAVKERANGEPQAILASSVLEAANAQSVEEKQNVPSATARVTLDQLVMKF